MKPLMKTSTLFAAMLTATTLVVGLSANVSYNTAMAAEVEGPKLNWNLSTWGKRRAFTEGLEALSAHIKEKTDGNFDIKIHYGGALSKPMCKRQSTLQFTTIPTHKRKWRAGMPAS